ncbi:MAG: peptidoglycan DD-metalloendopeptidase family protein [Patescibacteria group bacterium]
MLFWPKTKTESKNFLYPFGLALIFAGFLFAPSLALLEESDDITDEEKEQIVTEINEQIDQKQDQIDELQEKIDQYKKNIALKQREKATIQSEISLISDRIGKKETDILSKETTIEKLELEITDLQYRIGEKTKEIGYEKDDLGEIIREMYEYDQKTYLEVVVSNENFSDYFLQLQYIEALGNKTKDSLDSLKTLKESLEQQSVNLDDKKTEVEKERNNLQGEKQDLAGEKSYQDQLLFETQMDEGKFQSLVEQVKSEQSKANSAITDLEREMRTRLEGEEYDGSGAEIIAGDATLSWPVNPYLGISCGFHCADYPFARWFQHSGMDIRIPQGTALKAAASGYVAIAKDAGLGYSYILVVHGDGLATVYGHVSRIDVVPDQFVRRGDVIGATGGMPGSPGTGKFSTGAHLHFEVRVDGLPNDPMKYLPAS